MASYAINVTNANKDFKFWYAAVLQNPTDHNTNEQPSFVYYCTRGNKINPNSSDNLDINLFNASFKSIVSDRNNPFWSVASGDVVYRKWTCVSIDLTAFVGETVTMCFYVKDCTPGAHFGYIYVDGLCQSDNLKAEFTVPASLCDNSVPFIANGAASTNEESFYWELTESNSMGTFFPNKIVASEWFIGQTVTTLNIKSWLQTKGLKLKCNTYYNLKLAVQNACTAWNEKTRLFKYTCPTIYNEPNHSICCSNLSAPALPCFTLGLAPDQPGGPSITYTWSANGVGIMHGYYPKQVVCPDKTTQYVLTVTDQNGCKNTDTATVLFRGNLGLEILNTGNCCTTSLHANAVEAPCSAHNSNLNNLYQTNYNWTTTSGSQTQTVSTSNTLYPSTNGGTYTLTAKNTCGVVSKTVAVAPTLVLNSGTVPVIAFDQMVFNGNPMPIYHYAPASYPNNPIFWNGSPAYNAYGYRLTVYYRWNATSFSIQPSQIARVYESTGCSFLNNGDIKIDGYNSSGNYMQSGFYLFTLEVKDCFGNYFPVKQMYRKKLVCKGYTTYWLNAACGYCIIPTKICTDNS